MENTDYDHRYSCKVCGGDDCDCYNPCRNCGHYPCSCDFDGPGPDYMRRPSKIVGKNTKNYREKTSRSVDSGWRSREGEGTKWSPKSSVSRESRTSGSMKNSGSSSDYFCEHCKMVGHTIDRCYRLIACSKCGKLGHGPKSCRNVRSKSVTRGAKNTKLLVDDFLNEKDRLQAINDAQMDEMEFQKQMKEDEDEVKKETVRQKDEENEAKQSRARREDRFSAFTSTYGENKFAPIAPEDDDDGPSVRSEVINGPTLVESSDDDDVWERDTSSKSSVDEIRKNLSGSDESTIEVVFEDGIVGYMPEPNTAKVDNEDYEEDPRSYTFTSSISWPDLGSLFLELCKVFSWPVIFNIILVLLSMLIIVIMIISCIWYVFGGFLTLPFWMFLGSGYLLYFVGVIMTAAGAVTTLNFICLVFYGFKVLFRMLKWKNTYTFVNFLDADLVDLRTDTQLRSDTKHKDAVYSRYRYTRRLIYCYSDDYRDVGVFSVLVGRFLAWGLVALGRYVPSWLVEFDRVMVVSLEVFDQAKEYANVDPASSDAVASDKIKTALKRIGTIWVNRHLKIDTIYTTSFLVWAYFKHMQQKTKELPFYRAPLNLT